MLLEHHLILDLHLFDVFWCFFFVDGSWVVGVSVRFFWSKIQQLPVRGQEWGAQYPGRCPARKAGDTAWKDHVRWTGASCWFAAVKAVLAEIWNQLIANLILVTFRFEMTCFCFIVFVSWFLFSYCGSTCVCLYIHIVSPRNGELGTYDTISSTKQWITWILQAMDPITSDHSSSTNNSTHTTRAKNIAHRCQKRRCRCKKHPSHCSKNHPKIHLPRQQLQKTLITWGKNTQL